MENDKEKWIELVFSSMEGSQRAQPSPELFDKISEQCFTPERKLSPFQWKASVAAAAAIIIMNTFAFIQSIDQAKVTNTSPSNTEEQSLISNYNYYE